MIVQLRRLIANSTSLDPVAQQVQHRVYPRLAAADDQILLLVAPHPRQSWGYSPIKVPLYSTIMAFIYRLLE